MGDLSVLVAPRGPLAGVLDVLQDYSALGLVDPFLWVDGAGVLPTRVDARFVRDGRQHGTTLQHVLSREQYARVRICVLVPKVGTAEGLSLAIEQRVADLAQATAGGAEVHRIRCVVTRPWSGIGRGDLARAGWHNVLVSPEDSQGPGRAHTVLEPSTDPRNLGRYAAPVVAGLLGLWTGVAEAPLDDVQVLPGRSVRLVRSFYRNLDAGTVEQRLRTEVFSTSRGTPLPREQGQPAVHVDDVSLATGQMATALWTKHAAVLRGPRVAAAQVTVKRIGPLEALAMLFGFLAAAIRNAPAQWYAAVSNRVSSTIARGVHDAVFGASPAAYAVVVNGVTSSGLPVGWEDLAEAGVRLEHALATPGVQRSHESVASLAGVWKDYVLGALTLADGGNRSPALPPVRVGAACGVLRDVSDCVPGSDADFQDIPGYIAATVGTSRVAAADVLGAHALMRRLEHLAQDPATSLEAERTRQALAEWQRQRQRSYSAQVGGVLAARLLDLGAEIRRLIAGLAEAARAQEPDAASRLRQRRLARVMKILLAGFVVAVLGAVTLGVLEIITWTVAAIIGAAALLVWFITSFLVFMNQQRDLFRELNRRREAIAQAEAMRANLRQALSDQRRLASAYRQFLAWSGVLGAFLAAPFGRHPGVDSQVPTVRSGLPLTTRLGEAVVDEPVFADAVAQLRRDVFSTGWLTKPFEAAVNDIGRTLGPEAHDVRENPGLIFEAPGGPGETPLTRWRDALQRAGIAGSGADAHWSELLASLVGPRAEVGSRLVATVRPREAAAVPMPYANFMAGVDRPGDGPQVQYFDISILNEDAQMRADSSVEIQRGRSVRIGLGCVAVLTQFGAGLPDYEFQAGSPVGPVEPPPWQPPEPTDPPDLSGPIF